MKYFAIFFFVRRVHTDGAWKILKFQKMELSRMHYYYFFFFKKGERANIYS